MKRSGTRHRGVCVICGKPSKTTICDPCKAKVQGESLHKKIHTEKGKGH